MSHASPRPVLLLGAGKIGFAIALMLERSGDYSVLVADQDPVRLRAVAELGCETRHISDDDMLARCIEGRYAVVNALPFHRAIAVAGLCAKAGVHYFDLTEDVASTHAIQLLAQDARSVLMPQCGLAPGFIGIVGNALARRFDTLLDLRMRVGALPRYPSNSLRYNLTWSTEGLINEYCNPCEAIVDGQLTSVPALEGYETFALDGVEYEAFNTSGGLGTLPAMLATACGAERFAALARQRGARQAAGALLLLSAALTLAGPWLIDAFPQLHGHLPFDHMAAH